MSGVELRSSSSSKHRAGGTWEKMGYSNDKEKKNLVYSRRKIHINVDCTLLGYRLVGGSDYLMETGNMQFARLEASIRKARKSLAQMRRR